MRRDRPVVFGVSSIDDAEVTLRRAALMACWSYGFGAINIAQAVADPAWSRGGTTSASSTRRALRAGRAWSTASTRSPG